MALNLQELIDWYKTFEIVLWDKKWVFREPTIRQLSQLKDNSDLIKEIILEWDYYELEEQLKNLTLKKKEEFYNELLKGLGLK